MLEEIERSHEPGVVESSLGGWRTVVAAWFVAIIFLVLFTAAEALASRHKELPRESRLAGAVIPRHDAGVPGPDEIAASDWLARVRAEAYSCW
jgi:hypothetical protein